MKKVFGALILLIGGAVFLFGAASALGLGVNSAQEREVGLWTGIVACAVGAGLFVWGSSLTGLKGDK